MMQSIFQFRNLLRWWKVSFSFFSARFLGDSQEPSVGFALYFCTGFTYVTSKLLSFTFLYQNATHKKLKLDLASESLDVKKLTDSAFFLLFLTQILQPKNQNWGQQLNLQSKQIMRPFLRYPHFFKALYNDFVKFDQNHYQLSPSHFYVSCNALSYIRRWLKLQ